LRTLGQRNGDFSAALAVVAREIHEEELPSERAGTLIVFKVFDRVSYGLIIGARAPIQVADHAYSP